MNKLNKEDFTIEKFKQEAEQILMNFRYEEIKVQQIREEHKQLETIRDILRNIFKKKKTYTINLTEFEISTLTHVYALEQISARYGSSYTFNASLSDELNGESKLFQFWSNSCLNSQIKIDNFNKIEFGDKLANGSVSDYPILSLNNK